MRVAGAVVAIALSGLVALDAKGDTLRLKAGSPMEGTYLGGDSRTIQFMGSDGTTRAYNIADIASIEFKPSPVPAAAAAPPAAPAPQVSSTPPVAAAPVAASLAPKAGVTIPSGTRVSIRMIDTIDAKQTAVGERFRCSIDDPIVVGGETVLTREDNCTVQVMRADTGGRVSGSDELALKLYDVTVNGKSYDIASGYAELKTEGEGRKTARNAAIMGGVGAAIGAIAGGGKGAAIGAGAGAGAGVAASAIRGPHLKIPSETRLTFDLRAPLTL